MLKIYLGISLLCASAWLLLSGYFDNSLLLSFGVLSCALVIWLATRMKLLDDDLPSFTMLLRFKAYLPWIIIAIAQSNLDVIKRILAREIDISPTYFKIKPSQKTDLARVIFANSITLTPGTVAVQVDEDAIHVHALTQASADDLKGGDMDRRVTRLEG